MALPLENFEPGKLDVLRMLYSQQQDLGDDNYQHSMKLFRSHLYALIANSLLTIGIVISN
jgi:hypothetical protein